MNIAVIPARGGSRRIKGKNIYPLLGKPLIGYTIDAALKSNCFERVFVATDSQEISDVAIELGAEAPFLRSKYNDSDSPVSLATIAFVDELVSGGYTSSPDTVTQLFAVCPLITSADIKKSIFSYQANQRVFQISCAPFATGNPWWAFRLGKDNTAQWLFHEALSKRSQDLPKTFFPTGAIWIAQWDALLKANTFYGPSVKYEPISVECGIDIDWVEDLNYAERLLRLRSDVLST